MHEYEWLAIGGKLKIEYDEKRLYKYLDQDALEKGIELWIHDKYVSKRKNAALDFSTIDSHDADCIIQYSLFEKVQYKST